MQRPPPGALRQTLLWKYATVFAAIVSALLALGGAVEVWRSWRGSLAAAAQLQQAQAHFAASQLANAIARVQEAMRSGVAKFDADATLSELRLEGAALLRHHGVISELHWIGPDGREELALSRFGLVPPGSARDWSAAAPVQAARAGAGQDAGPSLGARPDSSAGSRPGMSPPGRPKGEYRSAQHEGAPLSTPGRAKGEYRSAQLDDAPVNAAPRGGAALGAPYFRKSSEPYVTLAVAQDGAASRGRVLIAELSLKALQPLLQALPLAAGSTVYAVSTGGELLVHPELSLMLARTPMLRLPQVRRALGLDAIKAPQAARADGPGGAAGATATISTTSNVEGRDNQPMAGDGGIDLQGRAVVWAAARGPGMPWVVVAEQPRATVLQPVFAAVAQTLALLALGLAATLIASVGLARRWVRPIRQIEAAARELADGRFEQRIDVATGDELQRLAEQFNRMAAHLAQTHATQEQRIAERTAALARADQAKTRFLAVASHDLRQPVHALALFAEQLSQARLAPVHKVLAQHIEDAAQSLQALVEGLLDLSRLDLDQTPVAPRDFALNDALQAVVALLAPSAQARGLGLRAVPTALWVHSDPALLQRILLNLVTNALRYTEQGRVLLGARQRGERVELFVADTGVGIAAEQLPRVWDEFHRAGAAGAAGGADISPAGGAGGEVGLGLGLSIVARLAARLGHRAALSSVPGRGTVARLWLPRALPALPADAERAADARLAAAGTTAVQRGVDADCADAGDGAVAAAVSVAEPLRGRRALVVDDDALARQALTAQLARWGCDVAAAASAPEALAQARHRAPEFVLCDLHLGPSDSALTLLPQLRLACGGTLPCIVVTGDGSAATLDRVRAAGWPLLNKPVAPARLRALLEHALHDPALLEHTLREAALPPG